MTRLSQHVLANGLLAEPLRVIDVGARGEPMPQFTPLAGCLETVGFEADAQECDRLNLAFGSQGFRFLPATLGAREEERTFYLTNFPDSSGLYRNRPEFWTRFTGAHINNLTVRGQITVRTETLDACLAQHNIGAPDFIKIDAEGGDYDVLQGSEHALSQSLGVYIEVLFQNVSHNPHFSDIDILLRRKGFRLYAFPWLCKFPRKIFPDPSCWVDGKETTWRSDRGQLIAGDALYFKDPIDCPNLIPEIGLEQPEKLLKFMCLLELFGHQDCAAELVLKYSSTLEFIMPPSLALDLLTPAINGEIVSYERYLEIAKCRSALPVAP